MMQYTARKVRKDKSKRKVQFKTTSFMGGPQHLRAPSFVGGAPPQSGEDADLAEAKQMEVCLCAHLVTGCSSRMGAVKYIGQASHTMCCCMH